MPTVVQLSSEGKLLSTYELPAGLRMEDGLTGISLDGQGSLLVEQEGGIYLTQLVNENGELAPAPLDGYEYNERLYFARPADLNTEEKSQGYILVDDKRIDVKVTHNLGGLRILGALSDGSFYTISEEVIIAPEVQVDQVVSHYDVNGKLLGVSRVPVDEQYTYIPHAIVVGPDEAVYALLARPEGYMRFV